MKKLKQLIEFYSKGFHENVGKATIALWARELFEKKNPQTLDEIDAIVRQAVGNWRTATRDRSAPFAERGRVLKLERSSNPHGLNIAFTPATPPKEIVQEYKQDPDRIANRQIVWKVFASIIGSQLSNKKLAVVIKTAEEKLKIKQLSFAVSFAKVLAEKYPWAIEKTKEALVAAGYPNEAALLRAGRRKEVQKVTDWKMRAAGQPPCESTYEV
ncbi:hypothetical protein K9M43_03295 [Candidatus Gracilibacteria bacterium]|nr:hypothetical protein [Candidatus Gracilibacteria bacterium]MCF7896941.1 hypothetical protein [Candidatus Gracilibacteria bacterium]